MINNKKALMNLDRYYGDRKPVTADIFLNDFCNNKCPYCTYARYGERNGESMRYDDFVKYAGILIDNGVKGIILTGGGEPMISKDFDRICGWLETNHIQYGVNTNFNVLKYIQPKYLKISLDAYDRESYIERRGVDAYDTVIFNIKCYLKWKKTNNVSTTVGLQAVADTLEHAQKFYEANKGLEVDYFNIRPMESTLSAYYRDSEKETERQAIVEWLEKMKLVDERICVNYKWYETKHRFNKCHASFMQIALNQRGEVMYCCHKPYEIIGHITDADIWEKKEKAITDISRCDVPCRMSAPNGMIEEIEKGCDESAFI